MSKKYYRVYFDWSCTPETQLGIMCDDEVVIESYEDYEDGETYFDHESDEEKTIASPEDASAKLTSRYMGDAIDPFDFINFMDRKNLIIMVRMNLKMVSVMKIAIQLKLKCILIVV